MGHSRGSITPAPLILAAMIVIVGAIHLARQILIPLALAVLLSFVLNPLVNRFMRWGLSRPLAVLATVALASTLILTITLTFVYEGVELADQLPHYRSNIAQKIEVFHAERGSRFDRLFQLTSGIAGGLDKFARGDSPSSRSAILNSPADAVGADHTQEPSEPVSVEVVPSSGTNLQSLLEMALRILITAGIVVVMTVFLLLAHQDMRNRLIRMIGNRPGQLPITTQVLDDAATRVSRYLGMQLLVNSIAGSMIGGGLFITGVPNAALWGLTAGVLRFIPYLGPWVGGAIPVAIAFAIDPGWSTSLWTAGLVITIELLTNNVLEPYFYGASAGISPTGILLSALVWAWLWGPIGLLLATPLTACIVVLGRHIPVMNFFTLLFGDEPAMPLHLRIYQRFLAMDPDEPDELARKYVAEHTVEQFYGEVLVPLLRLVEADRRQEALSSSACASIHRQTRVLLDDLAEVPDISTKDGADTVAATDAPAKLPAKKMRSDSAPLIACISAADTADELVARMVAHALHRRGIPASILEFDLTPTQQIDAVERMTPQAVCISAMPPYATVQTRQAVRRIRARFPTMRVVVGYWDQSTSDTALASRLGSLADVAIATTLPQAVELLQDRIKAVNS